MLKLLLYSAFIVPCVILPFTASTDDQIMSYKSVSFEKAYIEPEFEQLEKCEAAELDIFFHENYVTSHSAEYITAGLELSSACSAASYIIIPVVPSNSYIDENDVLETQTQELSSLLNAHGINAKIADAEYQQDFNSLSANGRTAKLKITFSESVNS